MAKMKNVGYFNARAFLANLQTIVSSLPQDSQKQDTEKALGQLVDFLNVLRKNVASLPTIEETQDVRLALSKIEQSLLNANVSSALVTAIGSRPRLGTHRKDTPLSDEETAKAKAELARLEQLPIDEIRAKLEGPAYSPADLRAIASVSGIRPSRKVDRAALVHQISMKIANYRGYKRLMQR